MKIWRLGFYLSLLSLGISSAQADYLPLRTDVQDERPEVAILQRSPDQVVMEIKLPGLLISEGSLEGKRWDRVTIPGGSQSSDLGAPEVPHFSRLLIIPATKGINAEFEALETTTLQNIELIPYQRFQPDEPMPAGEEVRFDMATYSLNGLYPPDRVLVGEPAIMRGLRVVVLRTNPVQYNPVTKELQVVTRYRINVRFAGTDLRNVPRRQFALSKTWANMMRSVSFNFDDSELDEQNMGSYLIVCENNSTLLTNLTPLIDWKRRKGHTVAVSTFADGASTTTIKNLIQTAYNNWPIPPEYVLLFGDTDSGSGYRLQGWSPSGIDHPYSQLDGTDILADVAIGRLPADDPTQTAIMINKVLFYEKMPYVAAQDWYKQACLVAGSSYSGLSTIQTNRWIKTRMIQHEFSRIDTFWYNMGGSSVAATINNAVNNVGVSYLNYRGYIGMENFETYHITAMTNGRKMPFVSTITCSTGGFDGASFMEMFVTTGSPTAGNAAVACIGTATSSTSTRFNNSVDYGIYAGIFDEDITQAGTALVRGKLELYWAHNPAEPGDVSNYSLWNALAGDPGLELFNGPIRAMTCDVPATATLGDNALSLTVSETAIGPLEGATVCVYKDSSLQYVAETDAGGLVTMSLTGIPAGNVKVTITKHNFNPILDSLNLVQADVAVGYYSHTISDDNVGGSSGDNDGVLNPGETAEIPLVFKNYGTSTTATGVSVAATESDPYGNLIDAGETFPDIAPGATANSADDFDLAVAANCPNGQIIRLNLTTTSVQGTWDGLMDLPVASYDMHLISAQATGGDTLVSPGETANLVLNLRNIGAKNAISLTATLVSLDSYVTVNDNSASFGNVNINAVANCNGNPFNITAAANAPPGHLADLQVTYSANLATQVDTFTIALGAKSVTDPQGPDNYGYFCFDNTDVNYLQRPVYSWVEIDPGYGGTGGTQVSLGDYGDSQDKSALVNLPFTFQYYGQDYSGQITVCSNGWISLDANVSFTDFRNYPIPAAVGPTAMIAAFWDDLIEQSGSPGGHVYTKNDAANHRFIIEWSRVKVRHSPSPIEIFEIILFDPTYYPTSTGDGRILIQYNTVQNVAGPGGAHYGDNGYSTVGIESPDHQDGLQIEYWNFYSPQAAPLAAGRAYFFSPDLDYSPQTSAVDITLTPVNPPIQIPAGGGTFSYDITITNGGASPATFDVWIMQKLPDGSWQGPMLGPVNVSLNPSATIMRNRNQNVPARAAAGAYYYTGYVGVYSAVKWDSSYFTYTKLASGNGASSVNDWNNWGEGFEPWMAGGQIVPIGSVPREFALRDAYPNPFNPSATLTFELPEASLVQLDLFDLQGRKVAELVNGLTDAGVHQVVWDASGQASGLYFCRIKAGEFNAVRKMMLVK